MSATAEKLEVHVRSAERSILPTSASDGEIAKDAEGLKKNCSYVPIDVIGLTHSAKDVDVLKLKSNVYEKCLPAVCHLQGRRTSHSQEV